VQIGAENRNKVLAASVLGALALIQVVRMAWPDSTPAPVVSSVSTSSATKTSSSSSSSTSSSKTGTKAGVRLVADSQSSLDPTLRLQLLRSVEGLTYSGNGRNIFTEQAEPPKIPDVHTSVRTDPPVPQGPPPPPQITLKFFGFTNKPGEAKKVFLSEGEDVFIASEGDIVNRRYKVVHINANSVEIEDVLYKHSQSIPLTQS
jgi:hypothetical protein